MLPAEYIVGFTEGEGCFSLKFRVDKKIRESIMKSYFSWKAEFAISLRSDDIGILEKIRDTLRCGNIHISKTTNSARYSICDLDDLSNIVVPFFRGHPLIGKKEADFMLWAKAVCMLQQEKRIKNTDRDINNLISLKQIHKQMAEYKSRGRRAKWLE